MAPRLPPPRGGAGPGIPPVTERSTNHPTKEVAMTTPTLQVRLAAALATLVVGTPIAMALVDLLVLP